MLLEAADRVEPAGGRVFYVIQESDPGYADFLESHQPYVDGVSKVYKHSATSSVVSTDGIANAFNATVEGRNDYVMVVPSSTTYYVDSTITMNKMRTHFICPEGISANGNGMGCPGNWARISEITASTVLLTISAGTVEVAGLMLKGKQGATVIDVTGSVACVSIHDDFISLNTSGTVATQYGIKVSGASTQNFSIFNNWIGVYEPSAVAHIPALLAFTGGDSMRHVIRNNSFHSGAQQTNTQTIDVGLDLGGSYDCEVIGNRVYENRLGTQVITLPMKDNGYNFFVDNRIIYQGSLANAINGMDDDQGGVQNYIAIDGSKEATGLIGYA